jgi:hypothetical protein
MAMETSSAPGVDRAQGEVLPQITFDPQMTLEPQMTFDPQITFVPLTFDPQITLVANGAPLPQITLVAPMPFSCTVPLVLLNDAEGEAADPEGIVLSLYAAQMSTSPAPIVNKSAFPV